VETIETDGIAFVGPGSEWFWIALQFAQEFTSKPVAPAT
jgi:hypothetical protein